MWWQTAFEYKDKVNFGGEENSDGDADESEAKYFVGKDFMQGAGIGEGRTFSVFIVFLIK